MPELVASASVPEAKPKPDKYSSKALKKFFGKLTANIRSQPPKIDPDTKIPIRRHPKLEIAFLKSICGDVGICLSLNENFHMIMDMFDHFQDFTHLVDSPKILASGDNGTIRTLKYIKTTEGISFHAYGACKLTKHARNDNLMYEEMVGVYGVNRWCQHYPLFTRTYGSFVAPAQTKALLITQRGSVDRSAFDSLTRLHFPQDINTMCNQPENVCLVVQYYNNMTSLFDYVLQYDRHMAPGDASPEIPQILFQLYYTLYQCRDIFTHYDMHAGNLNLIRLPAGHHIDYEYEFQTSETGNTTSIIRFKSNFIVKLIDYGRSYFQGRDENDQPIDSATIIHMIEDAKRPGTQQKLCPRLGDFGVSNDPRFYFIDSTSNNQSHDLRLLKDLSEMISNRPDLKNTFQTFYPTLVKILRKTMYNSTFDRNTQSLVFYGTPHMMTLPLTMTDTGVIFNVRDAFFRLANYLNSNLDNVNDLNDAAFATSTSIGTLKVFPNHSKKMVFIRAPRQKQTGMASRFENPDFANT
jgi:hypothetical protein